MRLLFEEDEEIFSITEALEEAIDLGEVGKQFDVVFVILKAKAAEVLSQPFRLV
ncbi:protein of unknown function [Nitrospina watsonii]|uniref:Uncharacterized protein n=1 Tax=Nitrospina watsonii TaxID=1323948 RepID=A0ABM9HAE8_9BACT|nr:protein of unknown function [Nitrospina watsonii]